MWRCCIWPSVRFDCPGASGSIAVKGTRDGQTDLALALLRQIPSEWCARFKIRVLADAGFSTTELIPNAQKTRL